MMSVMSVGVLIFLMMKFHGREHALGVGLPHV